MRNIPIHGHARRGQTTPEYRSWQHMWTRVRISPWYQNVRVCARWKSFEAFLADMGPRPVGTTLDRRSNQGNYTPRNCRWATSIEQQNNRRDNLKLRVGRVTLGVAAWSERTGIAAYVIRQRLLKYGWSPAKAVSTPCRAWGRTT
jgi:hypothetical protein